MEAKIPKLDEDLNIVGETTITEALNNNWWRLVARVYVFDEAGNILLQRRSESMQVYPGRWDQSAGGHVDVGETNEEAAKREALEEIGVDAELDVSKLYA